MKVLVTGATGRVGANLVLALRVRGHTVRGFVYPGDASRAGKLDAFRDVELLRGDLRNPEAVRAAVAGVEAICHLGAAFGSPEDTKGYFDTNAGGTLHVLEAARAVAPGLRRLIYASTDATCFGLDRTFDTAPDVITEEMAHPNHAMPYVLTKWIGEHLCRMYCRQYGLPVTILRFANQFGPGEFLRPNGLPRAEFLLGGTLEQYRALSPRRAADEAALARLQTLWEESDGQERLLLARGPDGRPYKKHYCDVRDTVQGVVLAVERDEAAGQVFTLAGAAVVRWDEAIPYLSEVLGLPYLECVLSRRMHYEYDLSRIRHRLGFVPQHDLRSMVEAALAVRRGEDIGLVLTGVPYAPAPA